MNAIKPLIGTTRAPFLLLTPACVSVGAGTAYWETGTVNLFNLVLVFIGALSAHISVNVFNEYFDFKTGLDAKTCRTPFSGGSGSLPENPEIASSALWLAWLSFTITTGIGVYFLALQGMGLLPLGLIGLFLLVTYTTLWVNHPILCLLAPGLGFGILMVNGTHFALTGTYSLTALTASVIPSLLVSNLLLLNQFPDIEADRSVGRKNFPMIAGLQSSTTLYGILTGLAYTALVIGIVLSILPDLSALALLTIAIAIKSYLGVRQNLDDIPALLPFMGMNVVVNLLTPSLLGLGLFFG